MKAVNVRLCKSAIRQEMRTRRKGLSSEARAFASRIVCEKIFVRFDEAQEHWNVVAAYLASPDEIDLSALLKELLDRGVKIVVPRWEGSTYRLARLKSLSLDDLRLGPMGILEPKEADFVRPEDVRVWLVPGVAFTRDGTRLGYGGGWYDRLMMQAHGNALKLGVAHAFQVVERLPRETHDVLLTDVIDDATDSTAFRAVAKASVRL